jgi:two-component system, LytTR family, sensor histidine kinase NatK
VFIAILGTVHLQRLFLNHIPIYLTCLVVLGIVFYFYKKTLLMIKSLGIWGNGLIFFMQLLLLIPFKSIWTAMAAFLVFIGLEIIRVTGARKVAILQQDVMQLEEQSAHFNEVFRVVRSERHDFLKHVSAVHFMLENGNHVDAKAYLDDLIDGYKITNLSIKGERGIVAGVLHQTYQRAQKAGISIIYDLDLPLSTLPLTDKHLVELIGNLLLNSLDACEEWQNLHHEQGQISLQFYKRSGLFLLTCKNSSPPIPASVIDELFNSYGNTTKDGHEGLGTKIIQDIIREYQGFLDFSYKGEEFSVKIKIPAIQWPGA